MHRVATAALGCLLVTTAAGHAGEERLTCPMGREYFLYTPDHVARPQVAPAAPRTLWLVVGVHGYRGKGQGAAGLARWTERGDVIVVGPSFPDGYQGLGLESDSQLIGIFTALRERFPLHPKMFVHGFSGGAQFAHRFTLAHPDLVAGCSAHSGGTWDDRLNPAAGGVPFVVSCGANDTDKSMPSSPLGRLEWFQAFVGRMNAESFSFKARVWPGFGHEAAPGVARMTQECFGLATTGMHEPEFRATVAEIDRIDRMIAAGRRDEAKQRIRQLRNSAATRPETSDPPPARRGTGAAAMDRGAGVPGVEEDACGWRISAAGKQSLAAVREAFVQQAADDLSARVEAAVGRGRAKTGRTQ